MAVYEVELDDGQVFDVEVEGDEVPTSDALLKAMQPFLATMPPPRPPRPDQAPTPMALGAPLEAGQLPLRPNSRSLTTPPRFTFLGAPETIAPAVPGTLTTYPHQTTGLPPLEVDRSRLPSGPAPAGPAPGQAPLTGDDLRRQLAPLPEKAALSLAAGTGGLVQNVGSTLRWLGATDTGRSLVETGAATQQRYQVPHKGDLGWRSLVDPEYYAVNWAENLPTSVALLPLAVIGTYAGSGVGAAVGLGWFGKTVLSSLFGGVLSRTVESTLEAGQTYDEARTEGLTDREATQRANQVFGENLSLAGLDAVQLALVLYPGARGRFLATELRKGGQAAQVALTSLHTEMQRVGPGALRSVLSTVGLLGTEAAIEGGEEVVQLGIQRGAAGHPRPGINPLQWDAETQEAFRQGGITGVAMGAAGKTFQVLTQRTVDTLPPALSATYATLVEQGQRQGLTPAQAQLRALDTLSQTPAGHAHVAAVAQTALTLPTGMQAEVGVPSVDPLAPQAAPPGTPSATAPPALPTGSHPEVGVASVASVASVAPRPVPIPQQKPPGPTVPQASGIVPALPTSTSQRVERFRPLIDAAATRHGLDPAVLAALIEVESGGNADARSPAGAQGLGQLMPGTARELGVGNPFDPAQNIDGTARYLAQQLKAFGGDLSLALAAYNAGRGAVQQHKGIPPFPETQRYVPAVLTAVGRYGGAVPGAPVVEAEDTTAQAEAQRNQDDADQRADEVALLQQEQALLDTESTAQTETLETAPAFGTEEASPVPHAALPPPSPATAPPALPTGSHPEVGVPSADPRAVPAPIPPAVERPASEAPTDTAPPAFVPSFRRGERVQFTRANGETATGTVDADAGEEVSIRADRVHRAGGVPILENVRIPATRVARVDDAPAAAESPTPAEDVATPATQPAPALPTGLQSEVGVPSASVAPRPPATPSSPATPAGPPSPGQRVRFPGRNPGETLEGIVQPPRTTHGPSTRVEVAVVDANGQDTGRVETVRPEALEVVASPEAPGAATSPTALTGAQPLTDAELTYPLFDAMFPLAGATVDGRAVRDHIPNTASIAATFDRGKSITLDGVRQVDMAFFGITPTFQVSHDQRIAELASALVLSRELNPLIVAIDATGPYILEGGHRFDALLALGAQAFPALVVVEPHAQPGIHLGDYGRSYIAGLSPSPAPVDQAAVADPLTSDPVADTAFLQLAGRILQSFQAGEFPRNTMGLQALADALYGGTRSDGAYSTKDLYDALELAVNLSIQHDGVLPTGSLPEALALLHDLETFLAQLPTQTVRTQEQIDAQQFSTPPTYAFVAAWAANILPSDIVLEPSAGTGSLAVWASNVVTQAQVATNELAPRRLAALQALGFTPTSDDALFLHSLFTHHQRQTPTVVLMNPPFSAAVAQGRPGGRGRDTRNRGGVTRRDMLVGATHIEEALKLLQPGGRLVAIVGEGMSMEAVTFRPWWTKIRKQYTVRANLHIAKETYRKYGTSFGTRLLVIDKTGPQGTQPILRSGPEAISLAQALTLIEGVRDGRTHALPVHTGDRPALAPNGGPVPQPVPGSGTPADGLGASDQTARPAARPGGGRAGAAGSGGEPGRRPAGPPLPGQPPGAQPGGSNLRPEQPGRLEPAGGGADAPAALPGSDVRPVGAVDDAGLVPEAPPPTPPPAEVANPQAVNDLSESVFEPYSTAHLPTKGVKPHKGTLVQSAAMGAVPPARITYTPNLPKALITSGGLSGAQLEAVIYAGQAHQTLLDAPQALVEKGIHTIRKGYFVGDSTGVGKGREIAGIILDNLRQGRPKAVWISEKKKLFDDAKRDWVGIGQDVTQLFQLPSHYRTLAQKDGILFTTYDTLKGATKADKTITRLAQIVAWVGADFDGVIAFDESHSMSNNTDAKGDRGTQKASDRALAGLALQAALPNARIVYVSATGATEVSNLGYAERLGLWGPGTDFPTKRDFITEVSAGGVGVMELVARDMKALGVYQARSLSYDDVRYERLEHALTPEQVGTYNTLATAWQTVLRNMDAALAVAGGADENGKLDSKLRAGKLSQFWGEQQRFFNQILTALTMPSVLTAMDADLARGDAIVVQLTNTNAAGLERKLASMEEGEELEDLSLTPLETLITYVEKAFPTAQIVEETDDNGNLHKVPLVVGGVAIENPEAVALKNRLLDHLSSLYTSVPASPLEMLLDHVGPEQVAEVTGRDQRLVWTRNDEGQRVRILQRRTERQIQQEADHFMQDTRRILVFSEKGGTGRSYHADLDLPNQRPRRHYVLQAGWRADKAMQGLGRTHRTNQASAPTYILVTTDLPGHKRFVSSIARRLTQLGALTRGQRQTTTQGLFSERDNLESPLAKQALDMLIRDLTFNRVPDIPFEEFQAQSALRLLNDKGEPVDAEVKIPQFLNRLLAMTTDLQARVFAAFSDRLDTALERAIQDNTLDVGMETLRADHIERVQEQVIAHDEATGADTSLVTLKLFHKRAPLTWALLQRQQGDAGARRDGIGTLEAYARNKASGRVYAFLKAFPRTEGKSGLIIPQISRVGPAGRELLDRAEVGTAYTQVTPEEAQPLWDAQVAALDPFREQTLHLLTGVLLPHWKKLRGTTPRVYRVQTTDGHRYLGRTITQRELPAVLKNFGLDTSGEATAPAMSPTQAVAAVLDQGAVLTLANGWRLSRERVGGALRIQVSGPTYNEGILFVAHGGLFERHGARGRYFLPTGDRAADVMRRVTEQSGIVEAHLPEGKQWQDAKDGMALRASAGDTRAQVIRDVMARPREALEALATAGPLAGDIPAQLASRQAMVRRLEALHAQLGSLPGARRFANGKLRGQRVGEFATRSETIRTKLAYDLETLAHEMGHHLLKYLFHDTQALLAQTGRGPRLTGPEPVARLLQLHRAELVALASPGDSPLREGFAEFLRLYLTAPDVLQTEAPTFTPVFEQFLQQAEPSLAAELQGLQRDYTAWSAQSGIERLVSMIDYDAGRWSLPTWAGVETFFHHLYGYVFHTQHPLSRLVSAAERQLGQPTSFVHRLVHGTPRTEPVVSAEHDPSILAAVLRGSSGFGDAWVWQGQLDYASGEFIPGAPSLQQVLAPLVRPGQDNTQRWEAYMLGRRGLELLDRSSDPAAGPAAQQRAAKASGLLLRQSGHTRATLEATLQETVQQFPAFAQVHDAFQQWNQALLRYVRDSGSLSTEGYAAIVAMNQSYIPWHRVMDEGNWLSKVTGGPGRSAANVPDALKTLRGSLRPYAPPIESAMRQAYHLTRIAARQVVGRAAVDLTARLEGGGLFAVKVPAAIQVTNTSVRELQQQLEDAGLDIPDTAVDELLQVWRPDVWRLGRNEVTIVRSGQREVWEIRDPELYRTLLDLDRVTVQPFTRLLIAPLAFLTQVKRFSITASPTFWLKNALFRDQATLTAQTGQAPFVGFFKNLWEAVGQGPRYQSWAANGGLLSSFADLNYPALRQRRQELLQGKYPTTIQGGLHILTHPWEIVRLVYELSHAALNVSENATRLGIYEEAIAHPFLVDASGRAQKLRAAATARDGIIDFGRVGSGIQGLRLITFALGPALGGVDKMVRTLIQHPRRSALLLATMMLASYLIRYMNEDETPQFLNPATGLLESRRTIYRRLPQWLRDISHVAITRKGDGTPRIWAIPKTFDWGFLGHTLFERAVLDPMYNDPTQARGPLHNITTAASRQLGVNVIPDVALTYLENTYNWSTFRERPVVSRHLEGVMEAYRYEPHTSETARQLGALLGYAPVKIDNALRQGFLAQLGLRGSDAVLTTFLGPTGAKPPAWRFEEYPGVSAFLSRYPALNAEPFQLYREAAQAIDQKTKTLKMMQTQGDPRIQTLWIDPKTQTEAAWARWFAVMDHQLAEAHTAMRAVRADPVLSPDLKRTKLDTMTLGLLAGTEKFLDLYRAWEGATLQDRVQRSGHIEQLLRTPAGP